MHDVAVIGGGPGGSTAASLLARSGHDVVLFERERFPRFHVGESLLPHNMRIFDRLGITDRLRGRFLEKWGVEFISSDGGLNKLFHFAKSLDPRYPMCFQVPRSDFDNLLLESAGECGAVIHQNVAVKNVNEEPDGTWLLKTTDEKGTQIERRARFLVDASGRDGLLARRFKIRRMAPDQRRAALFAHYRGVPRREGRDSGNSLLVMMKDGWFWFIPFLDGRTSVGVVIDGSHVQGQKLSSEAMLERAIECCPSVSSLMRSAERVSPVYATSDWSYDSSRKAGRNWLLVGDAAAFIDPVFSTGVMLAMSSGELAADLLQQGLRAGHLSRRQVQIYESTFSRHLSQFRRMVATFYGDAFSRLCYVQESRFRLPDAVLTLLAGNVQPSWRVRWRLELFYFITTLYGRFDLGPRVPLHAVFEKPTGEAATGPASMPPGQDTHHPSADGVGSP